MIYFGIANIDGLPLFNDANDVGFWPILGSVDHQYPVFIIGLCSGNWQIRAKMPK